MPPCERKCSIRRLPRHETIMRRGETTIRDESPDCRKMQSTIVQAARYSILLWRNAQPAPRDKDACHESGGSRVHSVCGYAVTSHHDHQHVIIHIERQIDEHIGEKRQGEYAIFSLHGHYANSQFITAPSRANRAPPPPC